MYIEIPVGISSAAPGGSASGASMQARKSMPAEPAVAGCGKGNSRPMRGSKIRSFTVRCIGSATDVAGTHSVARQARDGASFTLTAAWAAVGRRQAVGNQGNELACDIDFRSAGDLGLAAGPDDRQRVVVAIERHAVVDLVGGNHVELLTL